MDAERKVNTLFLGSYSWGLVAGKTNTIFPWGSKSPLGRRRWWHAWYCAVVDCRAPEPAIWFHDVLRGDGSAFNRSEIEVIEQLSALSSEAREGGRAGAGIALGLRGDRRGPQLKSALDQHNETKRRMLL